MLRKIINYFHNRRLVSSIMKEKELLSRLTELEEELILLSISVEKYSDYDNPATQEDKREIYRHYLGSYGRSIESILKRLGWDSHDIDCYNNDFKESLISRVEKHLGREMVFK